MPSLQHRVVAGYARLFLRRHAAPREARLRRQFAEKRPSVTVPGGWRGNEHAGFAVWSYGEGAPLLYLHGGGYTGDIDKRHFLLCRQLAERTGRRIVLPQYPLAPEHTWRDSHAAIVDLATELASAGDLVVAGDSAGGGYALSVVQALRDRGDEVARLVLISPWVDLTASAPGMEQAAERDPWLRLDWLKLYARWWAGSEADRSRPEVSPALDSLAGLPPTLLLQGTRDLLYPENLVLRERARDAGWDLTFVERDGLIHVYPLLPIPEAKVAMAEMVRFID